MRIKKVRIENFRNLKLLEFDVDKSTVISGENELGKSNALNALVWFFTDTIYTDNSGVGENDINSIVPKNQVKGEHTSVSVEFVNGPTFTKMYKTGYDRTTGKPNKHTTEGYINSVGTKNMQEWNSKLMDTVNFNSTFTSVKELNLFIDPLYALQKLDAKQLRTLLVDLGCTATNEEIFKMGFEELRAYEGKYLGDFVNMRLDLKKQIKVINESVNKYQILVEQFNYVEEFDDSKLEEINKLITELNDERSKITAGGNDAAVREMEMKLQEKLIAITSEYNKLVNDISVKIMELESKKSLEYESIKNYNEALTKDIKNDIKRLETEIATNETSLRAYNKSLDTLRSNLSTTQNAAKSLLNKKSDYQAKLVAAKQRVFEGFITCPCCGQSFAPDANAEAEFEHHKQEDIKFYTEEINRFNKDIDKYKSECNSIILDANNTKAEISSLQELINDYNKSLDLRNNELINFKVSDTNDNIDKFNKEIEDLKHKLANIPSPEATVEYKEFKAKVDELKSSNNAAYMEQLNNITQRIDELESDREDLYIERSNWRQKLEHQESLKKAIAKLNDTEALLSKVDDFIHTMIVVINNKAKELTGIDFVMLEENLGNDGVKEVCYATIDGVPFAMINTAKKYQYGIKFIEKVKDILFSNFGKERNDLPILADKFEGIDHIEKIKSLTNEQLICTRVGLEPNITIL